MDIIDPMYGYHRPHVWISQTPCMDITDPMYGYHRIAIIDTTFKRKNYRTVKCLSWYLLLVFLLLLLLLLIQSIVILRIVSSISSNNVR